MSFRAILVANGEVFGGAERQILTLAQGLRANGAVTLVTLCDGDLARRASAEGIPTVILGTQSALDLGAVGRLRSALAAHPDAVIHINGYRAAVYCALALRGHSGRRIVKTEHGAPEMPRTGALLRAKYRGFMIADRVATRALHAHCVYVTKDLATVYSNWRIEHTSVIHNGLSTAGLKEAAGTSPYPAGTFPVAMVGRVEHVKGIDVALQALARIPKPHPVRLHIVGNGVELEHMRALAAQLGVTDDVTFHGHQGNPYPFIAHAGALLMSSRHEGLPYTVLEALYFGTPIIASDVGGLRETLTDGRTAQLVPREDPAALASAIQRQLESASLRETLSREGPRLVAEQFTAEKMAAAYAALYSAG